MTAKPLLIVVLMFPLFSSWGAPRVRSAESTVDNPHHVMRSRLADSKGLYVLLGAFDEGPSRAKERVELLASKLAADDVDAAALVGANEALRPLAGGQGSGAEALIARLSGSTLTASYVGNLGIVRVRKGVAERVALPHSLIEDFIRMRNVTAGEREMLRLEAPHRFVMVRSLGMAAKVEVETVRVQVEKGDRLAILNMDVLAAVSLEQYAQVLTSARRPADAAAGLLRLGASARLLAAPAVIVLFVG